MFNAEFVSLIGWQSMTVPVSAICQTICICCAVRQGSTIACMLMLKPLIFSWLILCNFLRAVASLHLVWMCRVPPILYLTLIVILHLASISFHCPCLTLQLLPCSDIVKFCMKYMSTSHWMSLVCRFWKKPCLISCLMPLSIVFLTTKSNPILPFHPCLWLIFTPPSYHLSPPNAVSALYPHQLSPDMAQHVDYLISEAQLQFVPPTAPSGILDEVWYFSKSREFS